MRKTYSKLGLEIIKDFNIEELLANKQLYTDVIKILKRFSKINFFIDTKVGENTLAIYFELDGKINLLYSGYGKGKNCLINPQLIETFSIYRLDDVKSIQDAVIGVRCEQEFLYKQF